MKTMIGYVSLWFPAWLQTEIDDYLFVIPEKRESFSGDLSNPLAGC
jgi:hypothetical protein